MEASFTDKILRAFKKINAEITIDTLEHDFSPRLGRFFCEEVLGYDSKDIRYERSRTDVTLLDDNGFRVVLIETKRPKVDISAKEWEEQAGKYADEHTRFIGLTNGYRFLLWYVGKDKKRNLKIELDFKSLIDAKKFSEDKLTTKETEYILYFGNITKEQVCCEEKYNKFNEYYAKIDVSDETGFKQLIEQLKIISNRHLRQYTYNAFDEYYAGYAQYKQAINEIEQLKKQNGKNTKQAVEIAKIELKTEGKYKKYAAFSGFHIWKALSNRLNDDDEENKQIFCKESIYVLLNRLLFIRICEDKGLLKKKISNGGIERLREELSEPIVGNSEVFKQIIKFSYSGAQKIYYHFYEKDNPLDWYESGNGELDNVLNKVIWLLNQFNFEKVDRDILGKIYEEYLPKEERKKLGEFYTPDQVIDYILDSVEYLPSKSIENKDLIDPACGSGGFLVRAARRLIGRQVVKFGKATPKESIDNKRWPEVFERLTPAECEEIINSVAIHLHGFDINPFAVSITEMNLLFQIIDLYSKVIKANTKFIVPRFKIYETDSLESVTNQTNLIHFYNATGKSLAKDKDSVDELKKKKYDFIVGNPPYVNTAKLGNEIQICQYRKTFSETIFRNFDLYIPFIQLGVQLMSKDGTLSYICSNQFMTKEYGKKLRSYLVKNVGLVELIDFEDNRVFDSATNYPLIFVFKKEHPQKTLCIVVKTEDDEIFFKIRDFKKDETKSASFQAFNLAPQYFSGKPWILRPKKEQEFLKMFEHFPRLSSRVTFVSGLRTGKDGAYIGSVTDREGPLWQITTKEKSTKIESTILRPVLKGKDVRKWYSKPIYYAIYPHQSIEPFTIPREVMSKEYPKALTYFNEINQTLDSRSWFKKNATELHGEFYAMMYFDLPEDFANAQIVTPALTKNTNFSIKDENVVFIGGTAGIIGISPKINKYALLGILNSKLFDYYLSMQPIKSGRFRQLSVNSLSEFPLPEENKKTEEQIALKVSQLLKLKNKNQDISTLEKEIDDLVYQLYGIKEERSIIERSIN